MEPRNSWLKTIWEDREKRVVFGLCLFLAVGVAVVYAQTSGFSFINYDDYGYIPRNPNVSGGLTWSNAKWAFTVMYKGNWCPLVWLSFMLDREFFGLWAGGFHLMNAALHIANTVMLFLVLMRYSKSLWLSFFAAAFFGLHPLHVESVAWVAERKDVLSTLFWLLTMLAYVRYVEKVTVWRYLTIIVLYAFGLMSKPMLVTLPFVLLVMDYWPLERLRPAVASGGSSGASLRRLVLEKAPLFILSAISCVITFIAQKSGEAVTSFEEFSFGQRVSNAMISYCNYILKMFWPVDLAAIYPHPGDKIVGWKVAASAAALLAVTVVVILLRRRRYLLAGWLWYLGTLVPVIGLMQVGAQAMADRYTYIPLTGVFIMLVWLAGDVVGQQRRRRFIAALAGSAIVAALGVLTFKQVGYWRDTKALLTHTTAVTKGNILAHNILGIYYAEKGDLDAQIRELEEIMKATPKDPAVFFKVAKGLAVGGWTDEAIKYYNQVLEMAPGDADTYCALALIQADSGDFEGAMELYRKGLQYNPQDGDLHGGLGSLLLQMGRIDEAIAELELAAKLKEDSAIYSNLGMAVLLKGDIAGAIASFNKAVQLDPANAEAHYNLGNCYLGQSQLADAAGEYRKAIKAKPTYAKAYGNLGVALAQMGAIDEAIACLRHIAEIEPNNPDTHFNLAGVLADKGLVDEAIASLHKVVGLAPADTVARCKLATLLLQKGRVEEAVAEYEEALKIDPANKDAQLGLQKSKEAHLTAEHAETAEKNKE
jgi:tetratricopeptide (TPR) repeat protein